MQLEIVDIFPPTCVSSEQNKKARRMNTRAQVGSFGWRVTKLIFFRPSLRLAPSSKHVCAKLNLHRCGVYSGLLLNCWVGNSVHIKLLSMWHWPENVEIQHYLEHTITILICQTVTLCYTNRFGVEKKQGLTSSSNLLISIWKWKTLSQEM